MENFKYKFAFYFSVLSLIVFFPIASTVSSFFEALSGIFIYKLEGQITLILAFLSVLLIWWSTKINLEKHSKKDPSEVVIDKFSGQLIATSFSGNSTVLNIITVILFRLFNILKSSYIKKAKNIKVTLIVMLNDRLSRKDSAIDIFLSQFQLKLV